MTKNKNEIVVLDKNIPVQIEDKDIHLLKFWAENPRVNSAIKEKYGNKKVPDEEVQAILKDQEHVKELYQEIRKHGGLIDEVIVRDNVVLEGNSRLCAYRMLYEKAEQSNDEDLMLKWSYIKAKVIPKDTDDEVISYMLGTWHITGKKQWDTFEKVAYLKRLSEQHGYSERKIGEIIRESETFVKNSIEAHDLMVEHEVYDLKKYSYFYEMVKNRAITNAHKLDPETRPKLIKAIKAGQFSRGEEIRDVPKVLKDKYARSALFDELVSFEEALEIAKDRNPEFDDAFYNSLKRTTTKLQTLTPRKAKKIQEDIKRNKDKKYIIARFEKEVKKFVKSVGLMLEVKVK